MQNRTSIETRHARRRTSVFALLLICTMSAPRLVHADERIARPSVPQDIQVAAGYKPFLVGHAYGTQNYVCVITPSGFQWLFIGPQATVFNASAEQTLTHFHSKNPIQSDAIQATWQDSHDSSAVWAKKFKGSTDPKYVSP